MLIPRPGGECESPFILALGPNMDGIGFRRALAVLIRGTPWMTRGSFINVGSSLAGTIVRISIEIHVFERARSKAVLTSRDDRPVVPRKLASWRSCCCRPPKVVGCIRKKIGT